MLKKLEENNSNNNENLVNNKVNLNSENIIEYYKYELNDLKRNNLKMENLLYNLNLIPLNNEILNKINEISINRNYISGINHLNNNLIKELEKIRKEIKNIENDIKEKAITCKSIFKK